MERVDIEMVVLKLMEKGRHWVLVVRDFHTICWDIVQIGDRFYSLGTWFVTIFKLEDWEKVKLLTPIDYERKFTRFPRQRRTPILFYFCTIYV